MEMERRRVYFKELGLDHWKERRGNPFANLFKNIVSNLHITERRPWLRKTDTEEYEYAKSC